METNVGTKVVRARLPEDVEVAEAVINPVEAVVIANDPDEVEAPDAAKLSVPAGMIVKASAPVEVDTALAVKSSGDTDDIANNPDDVLAPENVICTGPVMDNAREPEDVDAPLAAIGKPGLTLSS